MNRRWYVGRTVDCNGFFFRCVRGTKTRGNAHLFGDLVLQMRVGDLWRNVPDAVAFIIADFKYENEEVLYPREHGKKGGDKHLGECKKAATHGWEKSQSWLEYEQGEMSFEERAR